MAPGLEKEIGKSKPRSTRLYSAIALFFLAMAILSQFRLTGVDPHSVRPGSLEDFSAYHATRQLNIVLIVIDTLRADRLGTYGYSRPTSPHMDALAERGIRFARVEAQSSWTKASMASLWTSLYPERTGIHRFQHALPDSITLPAERLRDAGYRTVGIWRNGWVAPLFGTGQGFDRYLLPVPSPKTVNMHRTHLSSSGLGGTDLDATRSALEFLRAAGPAPFLLYIHYMDVHQYVSADTSPVFGLDLSDFYDSAIAWTDQNVGMLVEGLARADLLNNTLIVIASDHGEAFGEHGIEGHARMLYRETQHTPLIIALPMAMPSGIVVEEPVANIDLWPTLFEWTGIAHSDAVDGRSLTPLIRQAAGFPNEEAAGFRERVLLSQLDQSWGSRDREPEPLVAGLFEGHRFVWHRWEPEQFELYDLKNDPEERRNLARAQPRRVAAIRDRIRKLLEAKAPIEPALEVEVKAGQMAELRALGYVLPGPDPHPNPDDPVEAKEIESISP